MGGVGAWVALVAWVCGCVGHKIFGVGYKIFCVGQKIFLRGLLFWRDLGQWITQIKNYKNLTQSH